MKLFTFTVQGAQHLGVKTDRGAIDISSAMNLTGDKSIPSQIMDVIEGGARALSVLQGYVDSLLASEAYIPYVINENNLDYAPCVTHPNKIICVGLNYQKHAEETGAPMPEFPILFNKFNNTLLGHGHDVVLPKVSQKVDYEVELCVVIGKTAKYINKEKALDHVFGYCCVNDLSARDLQMRTQQWLLGKSCDGFSPLGPLLVTADEVGDPNNLNLSCTVNGELRQNSNTSDMIFYVDDIISYISQHMTLVPGDIILTGTPEGVIMGYPKDKQVYLQHGDVVTVEIEKLGTLTNRMVAE